MSWPWAQVSMIRAVTEDAALIGGPNQGTLSRRIKAAKHVAQPLTRLVEPAEQIVAAQVPKSLHDVISGEAALHVTHQLGGKSLRIGGRDHRRVIKVRQVTDLVANCPADSRSRRPPAGFIEPGYEFPDVGSLRRQVGGEFVHVGWHFALRSAALS